MTLPIDFYPWAFGLTAEQLDGSGSVTGLDLMSLWNEKHGHKYELKPESRVEEDLQVMLPMFNEWKEANKKAE